MLDAVDAARGWLAGGTTMLYIIDSTRTIDDIEKDFPEVASRHQFGVLGVHNLRQKMNEKGVAFERPCLVFEVCNPQQAKKILDTNMGISTVLPCRVSVYREGGRTKIATLRPTGLLGLFEKSQGQEQIAEEVERTLFQIMEELAGGKEIR